MGDLLEGHAGGVKVPIVVEPMDVGILGSAFRRDLVLFAITTRDVNAGACHHQVLQRGMLLGFDEGRGFLFESELDDGLVKIKLFPLLHLDRVQQVEDALADAGDLADELSVAVFEDDMAARNDHHGVCLMRLEESAQSLKARRREALGLGTHVLPLCAGE
jgi:hypothetical protein